MRNLILFFFVVVFASCTKKEFRDRQGEYTGIRIENATENVSVTVDYKGNNKIKVKGYTDEKLVWDENSQRYVYDQGSGVLNLAWFKGDSLFLHTTSGKSAAQTSVYYYLQKN
ncbi:MAG: hypothetical protein H6586_09515 [Flavobacteriales bacterium]|nr:hypothetical protein [Flavobacteriales bacterium]